MTCFKLLINYWYLLTLLVFVWFQIIIVEYLHERFPHFLSGEKVPGFQLTLAHSLPRFVVNCYKLIGTFLFGAAVNQSVTDICKFSVGRLRPHFLDVCRPNISASICDTNVAGVYVYVDNFTCTLPEDYKQLDSRFVCVLCVCVCVGHGGPWLLTLNFVDIFSKLITYLSQAFLQFCIMFLLRST